MDDSTPKKQREESIQTYKKSLQQKQSETEQEKIRQQKKELELEIRKLNRRKLLQIQELERQLAQEVQKCFFIGGEYGQKGSYIV